ncbi:hypothetical protein K2173_019331 [Erythroxylum novogranatense]|uniref:Uncharacterized protein n=1 Tax=Erythroxylum novogranatense TaxID=1862640 RepID=A0AAV8STH4_9ROSI|nr:hypothetical protein K2173_019331 [Erythroxylum novogranatense]
MMDWWHRLVFPVRRFWIAFSSRVKPRRNGGGGLLKLHNDVQNCGYEDVQIMWELLKRSELEPITKRKERPFWRVLVWSKPNSPSCSVHQA